MIVLDILACPIALRGDLTKWLMEISPGVFVGHVSTRVREGLWKRVKETCRNGRAILVYSTNNAQRLDFLVHGETWEPIDFDGIKLMLRTSPPRIKTQQSTISHGFSNAAKYRNSKRFSVIRASYPKDYIVLDVETTEQSPPADDIVRLNAMKVIRSEISEIFQPSTDSTAHIPHNNDRLRHILTTFRSFIGDMPIVIHNYDSSISLLIHSCSQHAIPLVKNKCIDIQALAMRVFHDLPNFDLKTLMSRLSVQRDANHPVLANCTAIKEIYEKLINLI